MGAAKEERDVRRSAMLCPICEALSKTNLLLRDGDRWWCAMHSPLPRDVAAVVNQRLGLPVEEPLPPLEEVRARGRGPSHAGRKL